jgi:hypothetical protein
VATSPKALVRDWRKQAPPFWGKSRSDKYKTLLLEKTESVLLEDQHWMFIRNGIALDAFAEWSKR